MFILCDFSSEISLIHLAKQKAFPIGLSVDLDFITSQLPFICDKTSKQLLQACLKSPKEEM